MTRKKPDSSESTPPPPSFETALAELEALIESLESGELSLEDSLKSFEKGVALARACQEALTKAEQKVAMLTAAEPDAELSPFDGD